MKLSIIQLKNIVNVFNIAYKIGDKIEIHKTSEGEETFVDIIKKQASVLNNHTPVVWLRNKGCYDLTFVKGIVKKEIDTKVLEAIEHIESLYPPDSNYYDTASIGKQLMRDSICQNVSNYNNWRKLPKSELFALAKANLIKEGEHDLAKNF